LTTGDNTGNAMRDMVRILQRLLCVIIFVCLSFSIADAAAKAVEDPGKYADEVMRLVFSNERDKAANVIADTAGRPDLAANVLGALNTMGGKQIDYNDKILDHTFGKDLRQIVYYCFIDGLGFFYFRFNFKMTSHGWLLTSFSFKPENNELFPKDFIDQ
jgi:hypothetical protein